MSAEPPNFAQRDYWNTSAGEKWARLQSVLDATFSDVTQLLLDGADPAAESAVLDIGCGAGDTTIAFAGRAGSVLGVDISAPLLDVARRRIAAASLANADVLEADAQTHALPSAAYDLVVSRFGVMFFADPPAAFANILASMKPGGRLLMACWAGLDQNPWFRLPAEAAASVLGPAEPTPPRAPGPMAFAEADYVRSILESAGFTAVTNTVATPKLRPPGTFEEAVGLATYVGPAARLIQEREAGEADVARVTARIAETMAPHRDGERLVVPAALNMYAARKPA